MYFISFQCVHGIKVSFVYDFTVAVDWLVEIECLPLLLQREITKHKQCNVSWCNSRSSLNGFENDAELSLLSQFDDWRTLLRFNSITTCIYSRIDWRNKINLNSNQQQIRYHPSLWFWNVTICVESVRLVDDTWASTQTSSMKFYVLCRPSSSSVKQFLVDFMIRTCRGELTFTAHLWAISKF